jgi:hypothetical protein
MARDKRKQGHVESTLIPGAPLPGGAGTVMQGITAEEWQRRKEWAKKQLAEWVKNRAQRQAGNSAKISSMEIEQP